MKKASDIAADLAKTLKESEEPVNQPCMPPEQFKFELGHLVLAYASSLPEKTQSLDQKMDTLKSDLGPYPYTAGGLGPERGVGGAIGALIGEIIEAMLK